MQRGCSAYAWKDLPKPLKIKCTSFPKQWFWGAWGSYLHDFGVLWAPLRHMRCPGWILDHFLAKNGVQIDPFGSLFWTLLPQTGCLKSDLIFGCLLGAVLVPARSAWGDSTTVNSDRIWGSSLSAKARFWIEFGSVLGCLWEPLWQHLATFCCIEFCIHGLIKMVASVQEMKSNKYLLKTFNENVEGLEHIDDQSKLYEQMSYVSSFLKTMIWMVQSFSYKHFC